MEFVFYTTFCGQSQEEILYLVLLHNQGSIKED